jgi:hypothetical protein
VDYSLQANASANTKSSKAQGLDDTEYCCANESSTLVCEILPLTGGKTQESKWHLRPAKSDAESVTYGQEISLDQTTSPQVSASDTIFCFTAGSPSQSERTAVTSWDEWDDQSRMLSHIDPITGKLGEIQFNSLL